MARDFDADDLFFAGVAARAERMSLLAILTDVADSVGYRDPGGLSVSEGFYAQRKLELEGLFRSLEDGNPALAARLHSRFDSARESVEDDRPQSTLMVSVCRAAVLFSQPVAASGGHHTHHVHSAS